MEIITQPGSLSLVGNMHHVVISSSTDISFVLSYHGNAESIVQHTYSPNDNGLIDIDLKNIILPLLSFRLQDFSTPYRQDNIVRRFSFTVSEIMNDDTPGSSLSHDFSVIRSGVDSFDGDTTSFLQQNFLTWQPNLKYVTYYTPEFLTYFATEDVSVVCKAYFEDGTDQRFLLADSIPSNECWTIPTQYAVIAGRCEKMPVYYDVWVENANGQRMTYVQRYVAGDMRSEEEEWILFENSLGGIDCFRAYGDSENTAEHTHNVAEIEEVFEEYRVDTTRKFKKNTGYLGRKERLWLLDFFPSLAKYIYVNSCIRRIVVIDSDVVYSAKELPSNYNFTYKYSDSRPYLNLPRTELPQTVLNISVPELGSFTIAPRLVEFPRISLSGGALFPVQNPYSEQWTVTTTEAIIDYIIAQLGANHSIGGGVGHTHNNYSVLASLEFFGRYLLSNAQKIYAGFADEAGKLSDDSPDWNKILRKDIDDTAQGIITFLRGICFGASQDWKITGDGDAILHDINAQNAIFNTLTAQNAHFFNLIIDEIKSVGGQLIITPANCRIDKVVEIGNDGWKCYFKKSDGNKAINNQWVPGMQAIHQEFNVADNGTRNYWRVVTAIGEEVDVEIDEENIFDCHYIILGNKQGEYKNDSSLGEKFIAAPQAGDDLSQLGFNEAWCLAQPNGTLPSDYKQLENAIILSAYNIPFIYTGPYKEDANGIQAPLYAAFSGINDFKVTEDNLLVGIAGNGHTFKGRVIIEQGSTLADGRDVNNLGVQEGNLLRNSGFTGDYESIEVDGNMDMSADTEVYSDPLKYWTATNALGKVDASAVEVVEETNAVSGYAATISGNLSQDIDVYPDTWYMLMFKAYISDNTSGTLSINLGGESKPVTATYTTQRFALPIHTGESVDEAYKKLVLSGEGITVYDLMLVQGNIPTEYKPSEKDNDKTLAELLNLEYLKKAIYEANTKILGGLILSAMVWVGKYVNGKQQNTGGMSGLYTDGNSPYLWGGGTFEQAIETIMYYASRRPEHYYDEEPEGHVNFAVTHGGRAILNDMIVRGWVYAIGGVFKNIHSPNYSFEIDESGNAKLRGEIESTKGKIGGWVLSPGGFMSEPSIEGDILSKWRNTNNTATESLAYLNTSTFLLQDVSVYGDDNLPVTKIGIGRFSDPRVYNVAGEDRYRDRSSALYIYRRMYWGQDNIFDNYYPAATIISDNSGTKDVALHLGGALRITGGVMEYGKVIVYNTRPTLWPVIDLSIGTTRTYYISWEESGEFDVYVPNLANVREQLGIKDSTTTFCVPVIIVNSALSNKRIHIFMEVDGSGNRAHIRDNNGGHWKDEESSDDNITLVKGDSVELLITYLGEGVTDGYYAQVIRKND